MPIAAVPQRGCLPTRGRSAGFADIVTDRFCTLYRTSGFPESFIAVKRESLLCPSYTWTSSVFLLLADGMSEW